MTTTSLVTNALGCARLPEQHTAENTTLHVKATIREFCVECKMWWVLCGALCDEWFGRQCRQGCQGHKARAGMSLCSSDQRDGSGFRFNGGAAGDLEKRCELQSPVQRKHSTAFKNALRWRSWPAPWMPDKVGQHPGILAAVQSWKGPSYCYMLIMVTFLVSWFKTGRS